MTGSLAYRKNERAILRGDVPPKYTRLLPFIPGEKIVEAGSAEGVLACLLARSGKSVTAIEANAERHKDALALAAHWGVTGITFVHGKIGDNLDWLEGADTFLAVRACYYWGEQTDDIFAAASMHVQNIVLCGNGNRAQRYRAGQMDEDGGPIGFHSSAEGMRALLERHGYTVVKELLEGDEIVVGQK